jgi:DNA primase
MHRAKEALQKEKRAVLVEGYIDVIACHMAGVKGALASLGTALAEDHAKLLRRWCEQVVILYDSDEAGQKAADRAVEILRGEGLITRVALMPQGEDPDTLLRTAGPAAVQQAVEGGLRPLEYKVQKIKATYRPEEDMFWTAVVEALATASNEMEEDRYIVELAALAPGATDQLSTQKALRNQVRRYKQQRRSAVVDEARPRALNPFRSTALHVSEIAIFKGLLEPGLRQLSWNVCGDADLFPTETGKGIAEAVRAAFPDSAPTEKAAVWTAKIEPEALRDTFTVAMYDPRVDRLTDRFLEDAIARLRAIQEQRKLQDSKRHLEGDDRLRDVYKRLKDRQGNDIPDAS